MKLAKYVLVFTILIVATAFVYFQTPYDNKVFNDIYSTIFMDENTINDDNSDKKSLEIDTNKISHDNISWQLIIHSIREEVLPDDRHHLISIFYQGNCI